MVDVQQIEAIVHDHHFEDYKWIDPKTILVAPWVRMKCTFGCTSYGEKASCPPNTPGVEECKRFFEDYSSALVFHFQKVAPDSEKRDAWSAHVNLGLVKLERDVFLAGYPKAFLLFMASCEMCADCVPKRADCKEPKLSRPTPEAMAVDVFATVRQIGYPIEVLTDPMNEMNRYAFLMIE